MRGARTGTVTVKLRAAERATTTEFREGEGGEEEAAAGSSPAPSKIVTLTTLLVVLALLPALLPHACSPV